MRIQTWMLGLLLILVILIASATKARAGVESWSFEPICYSGQLVGLRIATTEPGGIAIRFDPSGLCRDSI